MKSAKYILHFLIFLGFCGFSRVSKATIEEKQANYSHFLAETGLSLKFPPPPKKSAPQNTTGGGRRGSNCIQGNIPLIALMPQDRVIKTIADNPKIYWYLPLTTAKIAEFTLFNNDGTSLYTKRLPLPSTKGWINLTIPQAIFSQVQGKVDWEFSLVCDPRNRYRDQSISGKLEKVSLDYEQKENLGNVSIADDALLAAQTYANLSLWHETILAMQYLKDSEPEIWQEEWQEFLLSVGLPAEKLINAPFLGDLN
ncbi:MAG: DUF928 domain-containing protein [Cyanobacteria bacterium J083]|nr:MAG: DUF928 domain-containing protein [Cyanobacteria bacterium J083]